MSSVKDVLIGAAVIGAGIGATFIPVVGGYIAPVLFSYGTGKIIAGIAGADGGGASTLAVRLQGTQFNTRSTQSSIPVVYGIQRVGLKVFDYRLVDATDPISPNADPTALFPAADNDDVLAKVGAWCVGSEDGTGIGGIDNIRMYPDGVDVVVGGSGFSSAPSQIGVITKYEDNLLYILEDGDDAQNTRTELEDALGWSATMNAAGIAYGAFFFLFDQTVWDRGVPAITAEVTGNKVYDPRTSTWIGFAASGASADNSALCVLDYLTSKRYGSGVPYAARDGGTLDFIDEQSFIDAANYCDDLVSIPGATTEKRFRTNAVVSTARQTGANIADLLASCRGELIWQGGQYRLVIRQVTTAETFELTEDNIVGDIEWARKGTSVPNLIEASFPDSLDGDYVANSVTWPLVGDTTFLDEDNGLENRAEVQLPFTASYYQALRTIMVLLREARNDVLATITAHQSAMELQVGNVVKVTHEDPGWSQLEFMVMAMVLVPDGKIRLALQQYTAGAYTLDTLDAQPSTPTFNLPDPAGKLPASFEIENFREISRTTTTIKYAWTLGSNLARSFIHDFQEAQPYTVDKWPAETRLPDVILDTTDVEFEVSIPEAGFVGYFQVEGRQADGRFGDMERVLIFPSNVDADFISFLEVTVDQSDGSVLIEGWTTDRALSVAFAFNTGVDPTSPTEAMAEAQGTGATGGGLETGFTSDFAISLPATTLAEGEKIKVLCIAYLNVDGTGPDGTATDHGLPVGAQDQWIKIKLSSQIENAIVISEKMREGTQNFITDVVFTPDDWDTVSWSTGTLTLSDGSSHSIAAGTTGNLASDALRYIYFDKAVSTTVLQVTTDIAVAISEDAILLCVVHRATLGSGSGQNATSIPSIGSLGLNSDSLGPSSITNDELQALAVTGAKIAANTVVAANIAALTITAAEIAAVTITGAKIVANTIQSSEIAANTITGVEISGVVLSAIFADLGTIVAGYIQNAGNTAAIRISGSATLPTTNFIDFTATASNPFLKHPALTLEADGDADFSGVVSADTFTATTAVFDNTLQVKAAETFVVMEVESLFLKMFDSAGNTRVRLEGGGVTGSAGVIASPTSTGGLILRASGTGADVQLDPQGVVHFAYAKDATSRTAQTEWLPVKVDGAGNTRYIRLWA